MYFTILGEEKIRLDSYFPLEAPKFNRTVQLIIHNFEFPQKYKIHL